MDSKLNDYENVELVSVRVTGDSNKPFLDNGDIAIIDTKAVVKHGDIVACVYKGERLLKVMDYKNDLPVLISPNPQYQDLPIEEFVEFKVIGKVVERITKVGNIYASV